MSLLDCFSGSSKLHTVGLFCNFSGYIKDNIINVIASWTLTKCVQAHLVVFV